MSRARWNLQRLRTEPNYWRDRVLTTALDLDLFSWIGKGQKTAAALAARRGGREEVWRVFLDALCGMGLLRKRGGRYRNNTFGLRFLARGRASFLLPAHDAWGLWGRLPRLLTSGQRPRTIHPFDNDRRKTERLLLALHEDGKRIAPYLSARVSLSRCRTLMDVGGGCGTFALAFCRRHPGLRATVIEQAQTAPLARRVVKSEGLARRVKVIGRDFLRDELPVGFDAVWLSNVLHGHAPGENRLLLKKIHASLALRGKLFVREVFVHHERTRPQWAALFSVCLLLHTPQGRCYTIAEVRGWLRQAGFKRIEGPYPSSTLFFDPDSILIAEK